MGRTDSHLYEFRAAGVGCGVPDPDGLSEGPLPASKTTLRDVEDVGGKTIHYVYDIGDNWDHVVRIERVLDVAPGLSCPRLLKASGACPPEDVGGPWSHAEFLEALADPGHEQHQEMVRCHGAQFDPDDAGIDRVLDAFERLAAKRPHVRGKPASTDRHVPRPTPDGYAPDRRQYCARGAAPAAAVGCRSQR